MILLLRKKPQTILLNTVRPTGTSSADCRRLPIAGGLIYLFTLHLICAAGPAAAADGWRSAGSSQSQRAAAAAEQVPARSKFSDAAWDPWGERSDVRPRGRGPIPPAAAPLRMAEAAQKDPFEQAFDDALREPDEAADGVDAQPEPRERDPFDEIFDDQPDEESAGGQAPGDESTDGDSLEDASPLGDSDAAPDESIDEAFEDAFDEPTPAEVPDDSPAPGDAQPLPAPTSQPLERELQDAQDAVDRELQRRQLEDGIDDELPVASPFGDADEREAEEDPDQAALDKLLDLLQKDDPGDDAQLTDDERRQLAIERRLRELQEERLEAQERCEVEFDRLRADRIDTIDLNIRVDGEPGADFPYECELGDEKFIPRSWPEITYMWKATGICHKPLYFEQPQLERYGHSWGPWLQPVVSGAHFFVSVPILPYKMGIRTPNECVYTLGYYRPGSCAPYMVDPVPFTWRAAFFETGAWTAGVLALP